MSSTLGAVPVSDSGIFAPRRRGGACVSAGAVSKTYSSPKGLSKRTWAVVPLRSVTLFSILIVTEAWKLLAEMLVTSPTTCGPTRTWPSTGRLRTLEKVA